MNTRVGSAASASRSANSFCDSPIRSPAKRTSRLTGSTSSSPSRMRPVPGRPRARRKIASIRRRSSPYENGFADVVVAAALEPAQAVQLPGAAREQDQRQPRVDPRDERVRAPDARHEVQPRAVRQPDVHDREVRLAELEHAQGVAQRVRRQHLVAVGGQVVGEEGPDQRVVLDEKQCPWVGAHGPHRPRPRKFAPWSARSPAGLRRGEVPAGGELCDAAVSPRLEQPQGPGLDTSVAKGPARCIGARVRRARVLSRPQDRAAIYGICPMRAGVGEETISRTPLLRSPEAPDAPYAARTGGDSPDVPADRQAAGRVPRRDLEHKRQLERVRDSLLLRPEPRGAYSREA